VDTRRVRARRVEVAVIACAASVAWAGFAGLASLAGGARVGSVSLVACGLGALIDGSASAVLVWLFRADRDRSASSRERRRREDVATRAVAVAMLVGAGYVLVQTVEQLATRSHLARTGSSPTLLVCSLVLLSVLGVVKLRLGRALGSRALRGDGILSLVGAALALTTLVGLVADQRLGRWRTDPVAALLIASVLLREGVRTLRPYGRARSAESRDELDHRQVDQFDADEREHQPAQAVDEKVAAEQGRG
jgi:divalent metal cation (Fe/Co/Zn/Cd) transporter